MLDTLRPKTVVGIKSLARSLKKRDGGTHSLALNKASIQSGFPNYNIALKRLGDGHVATPTLVTAHWRGRDENGQYRAGRKTLILYLEKPVGELLSRQQIRAMASIYWARLAASDHIVVKNLQDSPAQAEGAAIDIARRVLFMLKTGLRPPIGKNRAPNSYDFWPEIPGQDHVREWCHTDSKAFIVTDEPYFNKISSDPEKTDREVWAKTSDWGLQSTSFSGLWNPNRTAFEVAFQKNSSLVVEKLIEKINALDDYFSKIDWSFEDGSFGEEVLTAETTAYQLKRSMPDATRHAFKSHKTVPLSWSADAKRRPNAIMSLDDHLKLGRMIKAVKFSNLHWDNLGRLNTVRSDLENWMFHERFHEDDDGGASTDIYYGGLDSDDVVVLRSKSKEGCISLLESSIELLKSRYPSCKPVRDMVHRLTMTKRLIAKAK